MSTFNYGCAVLLLISAAGCRGSNPSPSAPSVQLGTITPGIKSPPVPFVPPPPSTFHLTGIVADDDGRPVPDATVTIQSFLYGHSPTSVSRVTDARGFYSVDFDATPSGSVGTVRAESPGYDPSYNYVQPAAASQNVSQNVHFHRIKQVMAGESTLLTVVPGDTVCGDTEEFVCRTVHVVAPAKGTMTLEVVPVLSAVGAVLEAYGRGSPYHCCSLTASTPVTAGTEIIANVGMEWDSTASQSFVLNTSLAQP